MGSSKLSMVLAGLAGLLLGVSCATRNIGEELSPEFLSDAENQAVFPGKPDMDPDSGDGNSAPRITSMELERDPDRLCVSVWDRDRNSPLTLTITQADNLELESMELEVGNGESVEIPCWFTDQIHSAGARVWATVSDGEATGTERSAELDLLENIDYWHNRYIGVFPGATRASVGEPVEVQVVTADFPENLAFAYADSVAVTCEAGGDYIDDSLHISRAADTPAGMNSVWDSMDPAPEEFLLPDDFMLHARPVTDDPDRVFMTFNITPVNPSDVTEAGYIFSFEMSFNAPGIYHLGLLKFDEVARTYYSSANCDDQPWLNTSNTFHDYTTCVTVVE